MLAAVAITLPRWPLIGRRAELEVFETALCSGERTGLLIYGPAGVGKTRLADECLQWAAASGHPTEHVTGSRTTMALPLGAVASPDPTDRSTPSRCSRRPAGPFTNAIRAAAW
jgi:hypothetical protein